MKNVAASIRAKLLNLSRAKGVPLNALMEQYATGRFLYRLAESEYRERFVLKGAQLFRIWEAFLRKGKLAPTPLDEVVHVLSGFLLPVLQKQVSNQHWLPDRYWHSPSIKTRS